MPRALIAVVVIAGVLGMHGFTVDHRSAVGTSTHGASTHGGHAGADASPHAPAPPAISAGASVESITAESIMPASGPGHDMGELCLAILTGLLLVLIGMIAAFGLRPDLGSSPVRIDRPRRHGRLRTPTLMELCVLRT